ncbi:hypothetical protein NY547_08355 [Cnuibacter physcomitrellae]|uniref:hypothetical protein n=1 Tax=Cnuibacter physcomitrellae TaxID=1619308 RepID=UPI00217592B6|nr:hypothetical protein [Cnuibacter physcomitrellae]MCS5497243.1 hypothetical protein [Cnuibacter physcomitrellae]
MRIALAGIDSSRPVRIARHIATLGSNGHRLTGIATEGRLPSAELQEVLPPDVSVVERPRDLIGLADAVLEFGRAAVDRTARVLPLLDAGLPVLVDKPLALTRDAAELLADRARRRGVALIADSGYRTAPALAAVLAGTGGDAGPEQLLSISGPADPGSPWGGLAFYGSHHAQILQELRPDALAKTESLEVRRGMGGEISAQVGERVQLRFTDPAGSDGFAVTIGDRTVPLAPAPDYLERLIDHFLAECTAPRHDDGWRRRLVDPVALLERISGGLLRLP